SARKDGYLLKKEGQNFYLDRQPVPGRIDFIYSPVKITDFLIELLEFLEAKNDGRVKLNLRPVVLAKGEGSARRETDEIRRRYVIRHDYPEKFLPYLKAWLKEPDKTAWQNPLKKIGLNPETIKARSNTAEIETLYLADITFLVNLGVHEWPVFLFNNQEVGGVRNLKEFTYCYDRLEGFLNREVVPQSEAGHTDVVTATAISADGTYAVSGSKDHSLIIWNPVTGGEIRKLAGHRGRITSVALDEKRGWLISGGTDQKIRIWNKDTGQLLKSLASKWTTALALTPDGKYLLSGSQEKSDKNFVKVWDLASGKVMRSLPGHADRVSSMGITPDGRYVITGSWDDYEVKIREFSTGRVTARLPGGSYHFLAVSQDNERVVTGGKDGLVKLWDLSGKLIKTMRGKHDNVVMSVLLSPDGRTVASAGLDGTIRFWEAATGKQTKVIADQGDIFSLSLDKNGDRLISGNADSSVKVWSFPEGELRKTLGGKKSPVTALALRGGWIYAGRRDGWLIAREVKTKKIVIRVFAHQGGVNSLAVSPDRNWLISGGDDGYLKVWRADTGELVRSVKSGGGRVSTVAVSPDGKTVASGNWDKNIRIWERATGKLRKILTSHDNMVSVVAFNPQDSNKLVSASWDETIRFWDLATGKTSRTLKGDFTYIRSLAFSPDGKEIACENLYHQVQVWNAEEGTLLTATAPEMGGILSLVYSKNGKRVYAAYEDNAVRVWNHYSGKLLKTLSGHSSEVTSLALAETALISGGKDGDIRIWPLNKQHGL
ncbi:MAG: WD40 repeat domain-containing protein, partial [bacterium]